MAFHQFLHLLQLELVVGVKGDHQLVAFNAAFAAFEIVACADLALGALEGVIDLGQVGTRNDIETWHGDLAISYQPARALRARP